MVEYQWGLMDISQSTTAPVRQTAKIGIIGYVVIRSLTVHDGSPVSSWRVEKYRPGSPVEQEEFGFNRGIVKLRPHPLVDARRKEQDGHDE